MVTQKAGCKELNISQQVAYVLKKAPVIYYMANSHYWTVVDASLHARIQKVLLTESNFDNVFLVDD